MLYMYTYLVSWLSIQTKLYHHFVGKNSLILNNTRQINFKKNVKGNILQVHLMIIGIYEQVICARFVS